ncbi:unnamed protein product [Meganyctiphanes norvegica]|uniref:Uncharacterized protein n=1 Tax=Meganyctiphanes norvegica TaxID=48144 RepID=A0AAV2Q8H2_MEGNR
MATSLEASTQLENTGQIELECQLVQEQLITLTTARSELLREFEQLISGSARLLLQIQEDASPASERKLHKYEAQKRLLEERLTSLETELREKAEKLAELDSKAGDYLLKVSSSGCFYRGR